MCFFTDAVPRLSCELGLPSLIPVDAFEVSPGEEAVLPPEFISKLRIVLYLSRINDMQSKDTSMSDKSRVRMIHVFEKDLDLMVSELRQSTFTWNPSVQFIYQAVLLNLYSSCLLRASSKSPINTDQTIIQSSAASCAGQLIQIYTMSTGAEPCPHRYYPKFYRQFSVVSLITLLKISALNQIPLSQLGEMQDFIRLGHSALVNCSCSHSDEAHKAAAIVEILCRKNVINTYHAGPSSESRFGASLWHELIAVAIRWHRQMHTRPKESDRDYNGASGIPPASSATTADSGTEAMLSPTSNANSEAARLGLEFGLANFDLFPSTIDDWSTQLQNEYMDVGLSQDYGWWGGIGAGFNL